MKYTPFVYWKEPGDDSVYTVTNPGLKETNTPRIDAEGFLMYPYESKKGYLFEGKIEKTDHLIFDTNVLKDEEAPLSSGFEEYTSITKLAIDKIKKGIFQKVVLARSFCIPLPLHFDPMRFFTSLKSKYPSALVYCAGFNQTIWVGATPEIFLKKESDTYLTYALAGTTTTDESLSFGTKEKSEQALVKDYIVETLSNQMVSHLIINKVTELNTGNLRHLINEITFKTSEPLNVITHLHPTPAVCGTPLSAAKEFIKTYENLDREYYSGMVGPVYANNDFALWVNLRCGKITNKRITLYAGAGIVSESVPTLEWQETEKKMETLRACL